MEAMGLAIEAVEKKQMSTERSIKKDLERKYVSGFNHVDATTCMEYLKAVLAISSDFKLRYIQATHPGRCQYLDINASEEIRNVISSLLKERGWIDRCSQHLADANNGFEMDSLALMLSESDQATGQRMLVRLKLADAFIRLRHISLMLVSGKDWLLDIGKEYCQAETAFTALEQVLSSGRCKQFYDMLNQEYNRIKKLERHVNDTLKKLDQIAEKVEQRMEQLYNSAYAQKADTSNWENANIWKDGTKRNLDWITDQLIDLAMKVRFTDVPIGDPVTAELWDSVVEVRDRILEFDSGIDEIRLLATFATEMESRLSKHNLHLIMAIMVMV